MNVLILGSGGREHAFAWKISQSPLCSSLFIAPGNAGTSELGENLDIRVSDFESIRTAVLKYKIDFLLVGPEEPLVKGIRDFFESDPDLRNIPLLGPGSAGALLEGSKDFAKAFMQRHSIPTASYKTFNRGDYESATAYLDEIPAPYVLKADGLAAGKGVLICATRDEAKTELGKMMLESRFGNATNKVVIEAFLDGIELSVFVLTDGNTYMLLPEAKDYKRVYDEDQGLNTGGMGAVSPVPFADPSFMKKVEERIVIPTVNGLKKDKIPYCGFVFIGLMNVAGDPYVIEYNVRMGDPETEVVLPRIKSDLLELLSSCAQKKLSRANLEVDERCALTVMLVSEGYPGDYSKGREIKIQEKLNDSLVFHAGTKKNQSGMTVSDGGRVIAVTSLASGIEEAREKTYQSISHIYFDGMHYRKDVGLDLLKDYAAKK